MTNGFDPEKYMAEQSKFILERVNKQEKLYLEFGGKLIGDKHAARCLPGFDEDAKIKLLQSLKDQAEIIICVYAGDIERNKIRGDYGITYDMDVFRLIDDLRSYGLLVNSVVITRYNGQPAATVFMNKLERRNIHVYTHEAIPGYPTDVDAIVSEQGYGRNPYITTEKPIVVVTAPGPGSGKLATCLSQLYHEHRLGHSSSYSKFETFPVWNIPLNEPLNIAYEAATVDLKDVNMLDHFHFNAYNKISVNYNRDLEMFPVVKRIIEKITHADCIYKSPTDMGVNRVGFGIIDMDIVRKASSQEIIRRYFHTACDYKKGIIDLEIIERMKLILKEVDLSPEDRPCVLPAREKAKTYPEGTSVIAIKLPTGELITGKSSSLMDCSSAAILNSIKYLAGLPDEILLLSRITLETIYNLKHEQLHIPSSSLNAGEVLIALSICAVTDTYAKFASSKLAELKGSEAHCTAMLSRAEEQLLKKLGIEVTCDPEYSSCNLFY